MARYKAPRIIGGILRFLFSLLIALVCGIVVWRVFFSANTPKDLKPLMANEHLSAAYAEYDGKLTFRYQNQPTITRGEKDKGYFSVPFCVFIPEAEQVQIIFRYNNSTIRHLKEDYGLEVLPEKSEHLFDVTLVRTTDLTPENPDDNENPETFSVTRYQPTAQMRAETSLYTYYRYVFDGVAVEDVTAGVFVDVYYTGDIDYSRADAYGRLCLYRPGDKWLNYSPTGADKKAMQADS